MGKRRDTSSQGASALNVRLTPDDRTAAPASKRRRKPKEVAEEALVDEPPEPPRRATVKPASKRSGRRSASRKGSSLGRLIYWGAVLSVWGVIGLIGLFGWVALHLPPIQSLEIPKRPPAVQIDAADGRIFATRGEMGGAAIPLKEMPAHLPNAFIAVEDRRFYSHHGIDPVGLIRAVLANVLHRGISRADRPLPSSLRRTCS